MTIIHLNEGNFETEAMKSETPVIIDFWAEWCGPCQMMGPVFEELSGEYDGKLKFAKVNTDSDPSIAQKFSIMGIPALVIVSGGKEIDRIVGFAPKEILKQKIDAIINKA